MKRNLYFCRKNIGVTLNKTNNFSHTSSILKILEINSDVTYLEVLSVWWLPNQNFNIKSFKKIKSTLIFQEKTPEFVSLISTDRNHTDSHHFEKQVCMMHTVKIPKKRESFWLWLWFKFPQNWGNIETQRFDSCWSLSENRMKISQYFHQANTLYHEHWKQAQNQEDDTQ